MTGGVPSKFDAVVVGAGPAGATAAYHLARRGFKVLLLERGRGAGSKELYGGRVYLGPLREAWPGLEKEAPVHRWVVEERLSILADGRLATISYRSPRPVSFTAYLPELTKWMVSKAEEAGALFVDEVRVDELVRDSKGRFVGVRSGPDTVYADVVVDAEGVNRLLLERAGIVSPLKATSSPIALGVKEVLKLGSRRINERLGLAEGEGLAWLLVGDVTRGVPGGGFIYTFKDTVSIGVVVHLGEAYEAIERGELDFHVKELVESIRLNPHLKSLWSDADIVEYGAHLTIEGGLDFMPPSLVYDGLVIVGDAAGFLLNLGYTVRGVDLAAYSGMLAAEAIARAHDNGGMTADNLRLYEDLVRSSIIYKELKRHKGISRLMRDQRLFMSYPKVVTSMLSRLLEAEHAHPTILEALLEASREGGGLLSLLGSLWRVVRSV